MEVVPLLDLVDGDPDAVLVTRFLKEILYVHVVVGTLLMPLIDSLKSNAKAVKAVVVDLEWCRVALDGFSTVTTIHDL